MKHAILLFLCSFPALGAAEYADWFALLNGLPLPPTWLRIVAEVTFTVVLFAVALSLDVIPATPHTPQREGD